MNDHLMMLYQEVLLDHNRQPRNYHTLDTPCQAKGHNPLCGDQVDVYVTLNDNIIEDVSFTGQGCAISTASASLMTEALKGKTVIEAKTLFTHFHTKITDDNEEAAAQNLGKLDVLTGVREFPTRVKCATLAWHTFQAAVNKENALITTE